MDYRENQINLNLKTTFSFISYLSKEYNLCSIPIVEIFFFRVKQINKMKSPQILSFGDVIFNILISIVLGVVDTVYIK